MPIAVVFQSSKPPFSQVYDVKCIIPLPLFTSAGDNHLADRSVSSCGRVQVQVRHLRTVLRGNVHRLQRRVVLPCAER